MLIDVLAAAPAAFDPEAATRAYLDTLQGAARERSDSYFEGGYWLPLWATLISVAAAWAMLHFGWSAAWRNWAERATKRRWLQPALYAVPFVLVSAAISLPWALYAEYYREKQYGLMNLSLGGWLGERSIMLGISVLITAVLLAIVFAVIRRAPRTWWLWGAASLTLL